MFGYICLAIYILCGYSMCACLSGYGRVQYVLCPFAQVHACIRTTMLKCIYIHIKKWIGGGGCRLVPYTYIYTYVRTYVRTYVCMYVYAHILCVCACVAVWLSVCLSSACLPVCLPVCVGSSWVQDSATWAPLRGSPSWAQPGPTLRTQCDQFVFWPWTGLAAAPNRTKLHT